MGFCTLSAAIAVTTHLGFAGSYNGIHPSITCTKNSIIAGAYLNSENRPSVFVGTHQGKDFWFEAGLVTGYAYPVVPMLRAGYKNVFVSPGMEVGTNKIGLVIGIEHKF